MEESYDYSFPIDCIFAELDILGFKKIIQARSESLSNAKNMNPHEAVAENHSNKVLHIDQIAESYQSHFISNIEDSNKDKATNIKSRIFSDTVVLYLEYGNYVTTRLENYKEKIYDYFNLLAIIMCNSLLMLNPNVFPNMAINLTSKFPIRGGIARGQIIAKEVNSNTPILIGEPVIDAYEWEQEQNWLGISINPKHRLGIQQLLSPDPIHDNLYDYWTQLISDNILVEYDVPVKIKKQREDGAYVVEAGYKKAFVVNFVPKERRFVNLILSALESEILSSSDSSIRSKYAETMKFIHFVTAKDKYIDTKKLKNNYTIVGQD